MHWIQDYQLFLFDFDGLLVNTEHLHHAAYRKLCAERGFDLDWDFPRYCLAAHYEATRLRDQIYAKFPQLQEQEPNWDVLYQEKKKFYLEILEQGSELMPGVERLLLALEKENIKRCVVTHSAHEQVQKIREQNPVLNTIPFWLTREDYSEPKPSPECYRVAIERYGAASDAVVGFEDCPRGMKALLGSRARPVLICSEDHPGVAELVDYEVSHYASFAAISHDGL